MKARHLARAALLAAAAALPSAPAAARPPAAAPSADFPEAVEADWVRQEERLGRRPEDPAALEDALDRLEKLLEDFRARWPDMDLPQTQTLAALRRRAAETRASDSHAWSSLYLQARWAARRLALRNPLLAARPIAFLKRRRFTCQMLHEYLGYYYDYADIAGGGVYVLTDPGRSFDVREVVGAQLGRGNFTTLSLSFDGKTLYFAFAARAEKKPDFYSPERTCFHIWSVGAGGNGLRQLTRGGDDDFDPCELPDGGIAFLSTRRGGFGRCHGEWEPLPAYTLHRMEPDGSGVRILSLHETNEWHPSVLADGRILYTRWDYVDRSAANFHGLWISNPDGTGSVSLFGNYTRRINACYQGRAIPGSHRIVFVAGAHHAAVGGSLVILDPAKARLDRETGENDFQAIERLTPEVCFPEAPGWPGSYFHSPWPLAEGYFLVAFSFEPLPGMGPGVRRDTHTGLYLLDRFGNLELLYREKGISAMYPIPLGPRPRPAIVPSSLDPSFGDEGELVLQRVGASLFPLPPDRPIVELRVFQILPKSETHIANRPRIGHANEESARMLLGTVPVEADGSAYFRVPARKPLYFQAVDASGRAVQGMRSATYLQPGERRGCVGCHEPRGSAPAASPSQALARAPSSIAPGPDGTRPWSFPRLVQPILDRRCVSCHGGKKGTPPLLTAEPDGPFTRSYKNLEPYVKWYEYGDRGIGGDVTRPGRLGADASPLTRVLTDKDHAAKTGLTDGELRRIYVWLDGNAAFYGTYSAAEELAQKKGEAVPPPALQ